ncbi:MAG TPA: hypothetical protein VIO59_13190 [Rhodanobacter sp.]
MATMDVHGVRADANPDLAAFANQKCQLRADSLNGSESLPRAPVARR